MRKDHWHHDGVRPGCSRAGRPVRAWIEGQRDAMTLIAVFGSLILLVLLAVGAETLLR